MLHVGAALFVLLVVAGIGLRIYELKISSEPGEDREVDEKETNEELLASIPPESADIPTPGKTDSNPSVPEGRKPSKNGGSRAVAKPALVRSWINLRSNWASAEKMLNISSPEAQMVSIAPSLSERNPTPAAPQVFHQRDETRHGETPGGSTPSAEPQRHGPTDRVLLCPP